MNTQKDILPILVVGSGLSGLATAVSLKSHGVDVEIVSPFFPALLTNRDSDLTAGHKYGSGRTTALLQSSHEFLNAIGIWDEVKADATPLKTMRLIDDQSTTDAPIEVKFSPTDLQAGNFEAFGYNVSNALLTNALMKRVHALEIPMHKAKVVGLDQGSDKATLRCSGGLKLSASLVIAADGANSTVRSLARIETEEQAFDQLALTLVVSHEKSHDFISTEFQKAHGPLTLVPLEGQMSSVVWSHRKQRAIEMLSLSDEELMGELETQTHGLLGKLNLVAGPGKFPVVSKRALSLHHKRVVLVAEAAHALPPIGAQGLNTSLMDVAHLTAQLINANQNQIDLFKSKPLEHQLNLYEQARYPDIRIRFKAVNLLNEFVTTRRTPVSSLRHFGLKANRDSQTVRNFFVERGMMWKSDLPALFQTSN